MSPCPHPPQYRGPSGRCYHPTADGSDCWTAGLRLEEAPAVPLTGIDPTTIADPILTREPDGTVSAVWPQPERESYAVAPAVLRELLAAHNALARTAGERVAVASPGDAIVLAFPGHMSRAEVEGLAESLRGRIPSGVETILVGGVEAVVVAKADALRTVESREATEELLEALGVRPPAAEGEPELEDGRA